MRNAIMTEFEDRMHLCRKIHPDFRPGDTIRVHFKIEEASKGGAEKKYRIQMFEGVCLCYKKGAAAASFTVRKIGANSVGVERIFSLSNPNLTSIKVNKSGVVRRARIFYLRDLTGKKARIKEKRV